MSRRKKTLEGVYRILDAIEPDAYGCHNWPRQDGLVGYYGTVEIEINGRRHGVHRVALERKLGRPIKPGLYALHSCDWKSCVNPDHLYEGKQGDNIKDGELRDRYYWRVKPKVAPTTKRAMWVERQRLVEERKKRK